MPTYEYECPKCNSSIERRCNIDARYEVPVCVTCDLGMIMKVPKVGLQFKGSGFYDTDYKGK